MKIESVRIENLRSFAEATVPFDNYTCLAGPNGAGKSTILCALNIFFRESESVATNLIQLDMEDFHRKKTEKLLPPLLRLTSRNMVDGERLRSSAIFRSENPCLRRK